MQRLFVAVYTDEDVTAALAPALRQRGYTAQSTAEAIYLSPQFSQRQFGELLRRMLRLLDSLAPDKIYNQVVFLQQFTR